MRLATSICRFRSDTASSRNSTELQPHVISQIVTRQELGFGISLTICVFFLPLRTRPTNGCISGSSSVLTRLFQTGLDDNEITFVSHVGAIGLARLPINILFCHPDESKTSRPQGPPESSQSLSGQVPPPSAQSSSGSAVMHLRPNTIPALCCSSGSSARRGPNDSLPVPPSQSFLLVADPKPGGHHSAGGRQNRRR